MSVLAVRGLVVTATLICISSCVPQFEFTLFNHSGRDLVLLVNHRTFPVRKDDAISVGELRLTLTITSGQDNWEYEPGKARMIPRDYWGWGFTAYEIRCQIEPNGSIYILGPNESMPANIDNAEMVSLLAEPIPKRVQ
jgi:hypothetical protein